jgi:ATP-binding cassette subfamily B protein
LSLLNYKTIAGITKSSRRGVDETLQRYRVLPSKPNTLGMLNAASGSSSPSVWWPCWRAARGEWMGAHLGDLVMVNAFMIQLAHSTRFLGVIYREIKQSLMTWTDVRTLMEEQERTDARCAAAGRWPVSTVRFEDGLLRPCSANLTPRLRDTTCAVAVVGSSGASKSALQLACCIASTAMQNVHHHRLGGISNGDPVQRAKCRGIVLGHRAVQHYNVIPRQTGG